MKLCSQCEFIYEDEQERCDMDGGELVYEPTLEHVFPRHSVQVMPELERPERARLIIPLTRLPQLETAAAPPTVRATRKRWATQIAATIVLAAVAFIAVYEGSGMMKTKPQTSGTAGATQSFEPSHLTAVGEVSAAADRPETRNAKLVTSQLSDSLEPPNAKLENAAAAIKRNAPNAKARTEVSALPGLKPLPRLKPLPTLKPLPGLAERNRSQNADHKALVVNAKVSPRKESGFGSFLKKTSRILTKPFKS